MGWSGPGMLKNILTGNMLPISIITCLVLVFSLLDSYKCFLWSICYTHSSPTCHNQNYFLCQYIRQDVLLIPNSFSLHALVLSLALPFPTYKLPLINSFEWPVASMKLKWKSNRWSASTPYSTMNYFTKWLAQLSSKSFTKVEVSIDELYLTVLLEQLWKGTLGTPRHIYVNGLAKFTCKMLEYNWFVCTILIFAHVKQLYMQMRILGYPETMPTNIMHTFFKHH